MSEHLPVMFVWDKTGKRIVASFVCPVQHLIHDETIYEIDTLRLPPGPYIFEMITPMTATQNMITFFHVQLDGHGEVLMMDSDA